MRYASIYLDTNLLLLSATAPHYLPLRLFLTHPAYPFHFIYLLTNNNEHLLLLFVWSSLSGGRMDGRRILFFCLYFLSSCLYHGLHLLSDVGN